MSEIGEKLNLMCDKNNSQDMKLLLLASLVDERFSEISDTQEELKRGIHKTNEGIAGLTKLVETYTKITNECPISQNKGAVQSWMYILKHPKTFLWVVVILMAILVLVTTTEAADWFKFFKV